MLIPLKEMYLGETAEISAIQGGKADKEIKCLRNMGLREGQLIDLLHFDPFVTQKMVIGSENSRIAFSTELGERIFVRPLRNYYETLKNLAHHDQLTGCLNRHAANEILQEEMEKFSRYQIPLSILLGDIDHFKQVNDRYGHPAGDSVLKTVADVARSVLRRSDIVSRWGGEEFLFVLRGTDLQEAGKVAEKIRQKVEETVFSTIESGAKVTLSIGGSGLPPAKKPDQIVSEADELLYRAKHAGRNRVLLWA